MILEPIMKVEVEGPSEFQGNIFGSINQRRGMIVSSEEEGSGCKIEAEVPLSEMFGYSTVLRSLTQGKAEFTMEFAKYRIFDGSALADAGQSRVYDGVCQIRTRSAKHLRRFESRVSEKAGIAKQIKNSLSKRNPARRQGFFVRLRQSGRGRSSI